ncbi:MAG: hypothetical protein JNM17_29065 [Archangium sp.]|nr:hypothetical protein [Archangium sp.]
MSLPLLILSLALNADDGIPLQQQAQIESDQAKAQAEVAKKYGNRKSSEMSQDERRQMIKDQAAADKAVLEKAGVDPKQWAREQMKRSRSDYATAKEMGKEIAEKEKQAAADAAKKGSGDGKETEVQVQRGISDDNPVMIDEKPVEDGKPGVEQGISDADAAAAQEQDRLENSGAASDGPSSGGSKPSGKGGKGGGKRR